MPGLCCREEKLVRLRAKWLAFGGGGIRDYIRARLEAEAAFLKEAQARLGQVARSKIPATEQRAIEGHSMGGGQYRASH